MPSCRGRRGVEVGRGVELEAAEGTTGRCTLQLVLSVGSAKEVAGGEQRIERELWINVRIGRVFEMRDLRRHVISVEARLRGIEEHLKPGEEQPEIKSKPWLDVASVTARTILFTVGTAVGAVLTKLYLGT
jgi:hypothetical protein